jgi:hypothetical protein
MDSEQTNTFYQGTLNACAATTPKRSCNISKLMMVKECFFLNGEYLYFITFRSILLIYVHHAIN